MYPPNKLSLTKYIPLSASLLTVLIGGLIFLGWAIDVQLLKSLLPGFATTKPLTAFAFVLCGFSLYLSVNLQHSVARFFGRFCAVTVVIIGTLTIYEYIFNQNWFDYLFFESKVVAEGISYPGRPSPITAISFLLVEVE